MSLVGGPAGSGGTEGDSLLTSFKIEDPTYVVSGRLYRFRYRAKNRQGWGAPSSTTTIMAAAVPGQLSPAATEMHDALVKVSWVLPDPPGYSSGGQAVTGFEVQILAADGTAAEEPTHCPPQTPSQRFCEIPMSVLTSTTAITDKFKLPLGQRIQARVAARNSIGLGPYSTWNLVGVLAQGAPLKPAQRPTRNPASTTSTTSLTVDYPFPVSVLPPLAYEDGGSTITSLNL